MKATVLVIHPDDNVGVVLDNVSAGAVLALPGGGTVTATVEVPLGHKVALRRIAGGEEVVKYGHPIGTVKEEVPAGTWVHLHNMIIEEED